MRPNVAALGQGALAQAPNAGGGRSAWDLGRDPEQWVRRLGRPTAGRIGPDG